MMLLTHCGFLELRGRTERNAEVLWVALPFALVVFGSRVLDKKPRNKFDEDNKEKPSDLLGNSPFGESLVWTVISILAASPNRWPI